MILFIDFSVELNFDLFIILFINPPIVDEPID